MNKPQIPPVDETAIPEGVAKGEQLATIIRARLALATRGRVHWEVYPQYMGRGVGQGMPDKPSGYVCSALLETEGWRWQSSALLRQGIVDLDGPAKAADYFAGHMMEAVVMWTADVVRLEDADAKAGQKYGHLYTPVMGELLALAHALADLNDTGTTYDEREEMGPNELAAFVWLWSEDDHSRPAVEKALGKMGLDQPDATGRDAVVGVLQDLDTTQEP